VERIGHVVNFDMPYDVESYIHRIGRTGRAGRSGEAILFVAPRERNMLRLIEQHTRQPLEPLRLPTVGDVNEKRVAKFKARITEALGRGDATPFRGIIDELVRESGVDAADLAAALASLAQGKTPLLLAKRTEEPAAEPRPRLERPDRGYRDQRDHRDDRGDDEPRRPRGPRHGEQLLYRLAVGRSHGIKVGNIVGAIANVGGIQGSDINGVDIQRDETFVRLPEGIAPETLEKIGQVKIRGQLLAIRLADAGPAPQKKKKKY
jgi:ATP-dependent RNA helicase DeaD